MFKSHGILDKSLFAHWSLEFGYYLEFGCWYFGFQGYNWSSKLPRSNWVSVNFDGIVQAIRYR
jgi:hypothetical protein